MSIYIIYFPGLLQKKKNILIDANFHCLIFDVTYAPYWVIVYIYKST